MNIIVAIILLAIIGYNTGVITTQVNSVIDNSPAKSAGVLANDTIKEIDGKKITTWEELSNTISTSKDKELIITIERDTKSITIAVKPEYNEESKSYIIGIEPKVVRPSLSKYILWIQTINRYDKINLFCF